VVFVQQTREKRSQNAGKTPFLIVWRSRLRHFTGAAVEIAAVIRGRRTGAAYAASSERCGSNKRGLTMLKFLTITAATLGMLSAAAAADLPRKEPPPPAPPVGKAPIGKYPVGKAPIGKYPQPVVTKG